MKLLAQVAQLAQIYENCTTVNGLRPCQRANTYWHRWHKHCFVVCRPWTVDFWQMTMNHGQCPLTTANARKFFCKQTTCSPANCKQKTFKSKKNEEYPGVRAPFEAYYSLFSTSLIFSSALALTSADLTMFLYNAMSIAKNKKHRIICTE